MGVSCPVSISTIWPLPLMCAATSRRARHGPFIIGIVRILRNKSKVRVDGGYVQPLGEIRCPLVVIDSLLAVLDGNNADGLGAFVKSVLVRRPTGSIDRRDLNAVLFNGRLQAGVNAVREIVRSGLARRNTKFLNTLQGGIRIFRDANNDP